MITTQICLRIKTAERYRCVNCDLFSTGAVNLRLCSLTRNKFGVTLHLDSSGRSTIIVQLQKSCMNRSLRQRNCIYATQVAERITVYPHFRSALNVVQQLVYLRIELPYMHQSLFSSIFTNLKHSLKFNFAATVL